MAPVCCCFYLILARWPLVIRPMLTFAVFATIGIAGCIQVLRISVDHTHNTVALTRWDHEPSFATDGTIHDCHVYLVTQFTQRKARGEASA